MDIKIVLVVLLINIVFGALTYFLILAFLDGMKKRIAVKELDAHQTEIKELKDKVEFLTCHLAKMENEFQSERIRVSTAICTMSEYMKLLKNQQKG